MHTLYHLWLSPQSRKVRLVLGEKALEVQLQSELIWDRRPDFLSLNPAGTIPVFVDSNGTIVSDHNAICEYLDEAYQQPPIIGHNPADRAEARRIAAWFDTKFDREVTRNLVDEKVMKRFMGMGQPDASAIRAGIQNIGYHLDYVTWLAERRHWLAGNDLSIADMAAAAHLSCIDYLGDVPWEKYPVAKEWYARIKSRPCFRSLLADRIAGLMPPQHYDDLDF